jgi:nicotinate-nucleotide pyrophosphorylase
VSLKNIKKISKTKVDRISIGSITHSAKAFDSSLDLKLSS